jgi:heme exporter protein C
MKTRVPTTVLLALLIFFAGYAGLFIAPTEANQGNIQRIFYFHVASWTAMFTALSVSVLGNIGWLATRKMNWDWLGVAGAEVGVICCTIGLVTGPLWAKPVWGIWWTWDARLTTTFILWLLYISYLLLRGLLEDPNRRATLSAVFGIFAYLDVPMVYISNRIFRTQHPAPVLFGGENSGLDPTMLKVLMIAMVSIVCLMVLVLVDRYRLERLRFEVEELRVAVESRVPPARAVALPSVPATKGVS